MKKLQKNHSEDYLWMLLGEETLKMTWDNQYDDRRDLFL